MSDEDILMVISNANGHQPSLFVPEKSFHLLVKRQISRLELPSVETVEAVRREMARICTTIAENSALSRFPHLHGQVVDTINDLLTEGMRSATFMVTHLIKIELAWLNTSHPNFIGGSRAVLQAMTRLQEERAAALERAEKIKSRTLGLYDKTDAIDATPLDGNTQGYQMHEQKKEKRTGWFSRSSKKALGDDYGAEEDDDDPNLVKLPQMPIKVEKGKTVTADKDKIEVDTIKKLVASYFNIVRKQMMDYVPKTVMAFLVKGITDGLQGELVSRLYSDATVEQMAVEAPETAEERVEMQESRKSLMKALRIVEDVRQMGGHGHGHGHGHGSM